MLSPSELKAKPTTLLPTEENRSAEQIRQSLVTLPKGSVTFGQKLGNGAFGIVYEGTYRGMRVAIKEVNPRKAGKGVDIPEADILQAFEWEVSRLSTLSHNNLVHFYGVCENTEGNACLVMELCQKETLEKRLKQARNAKLGITPIVSTEPTASAKSADSSEPQKEHTYDQVVSDEVEKPDEAAKSAYDAYDVIEDDQPKPVIQPALIKKSKVLIEPPLPLSEIWRIALEIAYGLAYLHQKGTLHRDLKSENILFGFDGHAKLADLGVAQVDALVEAQQAKVVAQGMKDFRYAAPEEFKGQSTPLCDMYSYGLILWELITGESVEASHTSWRKEGRPEVIPDYCPSSLRILIEQCWAIGPQQRPTAKEAMLGLEAVAHEYMDQPARACLAQQTLEILEDQRTALSEYIPSDVETSGEVIDIQTQLQNFMQGQMPVCVILGVGGLGKSLAGYVLTNQLLNHPGPTPPLPILIRPAIAPWTHTELTDGIQKALIHYRLTPQAIEQLKQTPVLFIVDGYDELLGDPQSNVPRQLGLDSWPQAKLLVSVRPNVVPEDKLKARFAHQDQLVQYTLKPFDLPKVQAYLKRALLPEEIASLQQALIQSNLGQTLTNPFVLSLFIKSWDSQKQQDLHQLTQAHIYKIAIQHWVYTQTNYLPPFVQHFLSGTDPIQPTALEKLLQAAQLWLYQTAFAMVKDQTLSLVPLAQHPWNQITQVVKQYAQDTMGERDRRIAAMPPKEAIQARKRVLLNAEQYQLLLQNKVQQFFALCPLKDRNGQQQFIHKTLLEYTVASGIIDTLSLPLEQAQQVKARGLHPNFILNDSGVLAFLQSMTRAPQIAQWEAWIEASKQTETASLPAACAITALNGLQKGLAYRQFAGIRIPEADLRNAMLEYSDLSGADLRGVQLGLASLKALRLHGTLLQGVQLGQKPMLQFEDSVMCIALHPSGTVLATGLENGDIVFRNLQTRAVVGTLKKHTDRICSIAFSPNGQLLASGGYDKTVCLWEVQSQSVRVIFKEHGNSVTSVAFSPDGQILASASDDQTIRLWEVQSQSARATLNGHTSGVTSVAFSTDGGFLVSGSDDRTICLWEVQSQSIRAILKGHEDRVTSVAFSPNGHLLASGSDDQTVRLWELQNQSPRAILNGHTGGVTSVAFSPNGQFLASAGSYYDNTIRLWEVQSQSVHATMKGYEDNVSRLTSVAFSRDGKFLVSGSKDRTVRLWIPSQSARATVLNSHTNEVTSVAFSPSGHLLASGNEDNTVCLWEVQSQNARATLKGHAKGVYTVTFSPDEQLLASGSKDNTVCLWEVQSQSSHATLKGHDEKVTSVTFSPNGQLLASGSMDETIRLWGVQSQNTHATLKWDECGGVMSVTFSLDGQFIASGSVYDTTIRLWEIQSQNVRSTLTGHERGVVSFAFSPNGQLLASGSVDNTIRLWDLQSQNAHATFEGVGRHLRATIPINSVAFSSDGRVLASGSANGTIRLWDLRKNQCLTTLYFLNSVSSVSYAMNGALAVASGNSVQLWQPDGRELLAPDVAALRLTWRTEVSNKLDATDCDLTNALGLTESDTALFEQSGAKGKPAPAAPSDFFEGQINQTSASSSISTSTSSSSSQILAANLLSSTELADTRSLVAGASATTSTSTQRISFGHSQSFFSQTHSSSSSSSTEPTSTSTMTTTTTVSTTVSVSSPMDQPPKKQGVAQLIAQFTVLGSKESSQASPKTKNSDMKLDTKRM